MASCCLTLSTFAVDASFAGSQGGGWGGSPWSPLAPQSLEISLFGTSGCPQAGVPNLDKQLVTLNPGDPRLLPANEQPRSTKLTLVAQ